MKKKQLRFLLILTAIYAVVSGLNILLPATSTQFSLDTNQFSLPLPLMALAVSLVVFIAYGLFGCLGYWLANKLKWPGIFNQQANWRQLILKPLIIGLVIGSFLILADFFFAKINQVGALVHPNFPYSILASIGAGIGEEIMFRLFIVSLWAFVLGFIFKKFKNRTIINWIAIIIGALAFSAGHFPSIMFLYGFKTFAQIPVFLLIEILFLNSLVGIIAGREFIKNGLIAAIGIHFWADIIWHVLNVAIKSF